MMSHTSPFLGVCLDGVGAGGMPVDTAPSMAIARNRISRARRSAGRSLVSVMPHPRDLPSEHMGAMPQRLPSSSTRPWGGGLDVAMIHGSWGPARAGCRGAWWSDGVPGGRHAGP